MSKFNLDISSLKGVTQDSRQVRSGYLFAAFSGKRLDGGKFIEDAIRNGASHILAETGSKLPEDAKNVILLTEDNPRKAFAEIAAEYYGVQPEMIAGVTGTNGKTSVADFVRQIWQGLGKQAASLGTLGVQSASVTQTGSMTTPHVTALHGYIADLGAAGVSHLAMEISSHGLDQYRVDGVKLKAAGFTNLSHDHLDYHIDMEEYFKAKKRLFEELLPENSLAVLNADIPEYKELEQTAEEAGCRVLSYGHKGRELKILKAIPTPHGQDARIELFGLEMDITLPLVGHFQLMNAMCALGLVLADESIDDEMAVKALESLRGVPGRLQLVKGHPKGAACYIDYAHTPDALENVLNALRPHTEGKLICVFGCGGDRDRAKRPVMGRIASELSDAAIVTDDNPRNEDPASIRAEILAACSDAREVGDRRTAIRTALAEAGQGDVVLVAGKGHETGQIIAGVHEEFSDFEEVTKAVEEL